VKPCMAGFSLAEGLNGHCNGKEDDTPKAMGFCHVNWAAVPHA